MKKLFLISCFIITVHFSEAQQLSSTIIGKPTTRAMYAANVAKAIQKAWENEFTTKDKKEALLDEIVFGTSSDFKVRQDITENNDKSITNNIDEIEEATGIIEQLKKPIKTKKEIVIDGKKIVVAMNTAPVIVDDTIEPDTIYAMPQIAAIFTGGQNAMQSFFSKNFHNPKSHGTLTKGKVFIRFMVKKNGELSRIYILKGLTEDCNKEALRLVRMMPTWIPAMEDGEKVNSWQTLPIDF